MIFLFRPVDVTAKENAVAERLAKDREVIKDRAAQQNQPMSRTTSRGGFDRSSRGPPPHNSGGSVSVPPSPRVANGQTAARGDANVRPTFSFAAAAANKKGEEKVKTETEEGSEGKEEQEEVKKVTDVTEQLGEVTI